MPLIPIEALGWLAAGLTLATFVCRDMRRLRLLALAANAAFIAYGASAALLPVLALHLALVPVNLWRLNQVFRAAPAGADAGPAGSGHRGLAGARRPRPRRRRGAAPALPPRLHGIGCDEGDAGDQRGAGPSSAASASRVSASAAEGSRPSARKASKTGSPSAVRNAGSALASACASSA